jgi:Tfp pilus assembly protein PilN
VAQQINLYRADFRSPTKIFATAHMVKLAALLLVVMVLVVGGIAYRTTLLRSQLTQYEQEEGALQQSLAELNKRFIARAGDPALMNEVAKLETLLNAPDAVREMLMNDAFGDTEGYSSYFVAFARRAVPGMWLTGVEIVGAGKQITLRGRAVVPERVPQYLQRLSAEKKLAGQEFALFQMTRPAPEEVATVDGSSRKVTHPYVEFVLKTKGEPKPKVQP